MTFTGIEHGVQKLPLRKGENICCWAKLDIAIEVLEQKQDLGEYLTPEGRVAKYENWNLFR